MRIPHVPHLRPSVFMATAIAAITLFPVVAMAHPLGNFTINHYAAIRVGPGVIALDVVVDYAEIPAFQKRLVIDANGDGDVSQAEADAARRTECDTLTGGLDLRANGESLPLHLVAAGVSFPAGAGGVPTMRTVCEFTAMPATRTATNDLITFADTNSIERIGWREIVVFGDSVSIGPVPGRAAPAAEDRSSRLTAYPKDLLAQPLNVASVAFMIAGPGPSILPFVAPDAVALRGPGSSPAPTAAETSPTPTRESIAAVPGGVGGDIPALFQADLTPLVALASILLAVALGAGHALTPGHGKTLMAAYLVGTRGTVRHAAGLGLAVTVSHTLGILVLAVLVTGGEALLPVDVVVRVVPVVAALAFVAIGVSMLATEIWRRRRADGVVAVHSHDSSAQPDSASRGAHRIVGTLEHQDPHAHPHPPGLATQIEHSHGGRHHRHVPPDARTLSWRSLFALGLAGGIIPSVNALIILLGTVVAGRAAFGIVLVVAFGLGMALVLGGVGAIMVLARERLDRLPLTSSLGRVGRNAPLAAAVVVFGVGLWLTVQAIGGAPTL